MPSPSSSSTSESARIGKEKRSESFAKGRRLPACTKVQADAHIMPHIAVVVGCVASVLPIDRLRAVGYGGYPGAYIQVRIGRGRLSTLPST